MLSVILRKNLVTSNTRKVASLAAFKSHLNNQIEGIKSAGTFKKERVIISKQAAFIDVEGSDKKILNFCANNYLGLSVIIYD